MKILMINSVCGIRSTGRICTDLATAISSLGHEVKIAYGRLDVPENYQNYAVRIGNNLNVGIHAGTSLIFDNSGFMSRKATEKLIDWIKNYDPDIIHLHNIHGYYLNIELLFEYLKTSGKKILWTLHDCWAFTGHCAYFDYSGCQKWKTGCFKCPSLKDYPPSLLLDRSQENYLKKSVSFNDVPDMTLITPSEWLAKLVHESFLKKYPVKVINNSINYDAFHPVQSEFKKKFEIENKIMVLGVASIWDRRKGLDDFIKLSSVLPNDFKIVLVGLSKKQIKNLPDNIIAISHTSNVLELVEIYSAADVFLNLTYEDNYPTTNLESQACGIPVITYNTGGSVESAKNFGIVVEKGNIQRVQEILISGEYKNCINNFRKNNFIDEYMKLYGIL